MAPGPVVGVTIRHRVHAKTKWSRGGGDGEGNEEEEIAFFLTK